MSLDIPPACPLRRTFGAAIERAFLGSLGVYEPGLCDYLTSLLTDFAHVRNLGSVTQLLAQTDGGARDYQRIGDGVLFWAGLYPESLRRFPVRHYVRQGKTSYAVAASLADGGGEQSRLLQTLSDEFYLCVQGLRVVRRDMDTWQGRMIP